MAVEVHPAVCNLRAPAELSRTVDSLKPLPHSVKVTIDLANDVAEFLQAQVRAGVFADPSELANDVLRSVRELQRQPFPLTPELEAWLLESAEQPTTPLTAADFADIRERVRARIANSGA